MQRNGLLWSYDEDCGEVRVCVRDRGRDWDAEAETEGEGVRGVMENGGLVVEVGVGEVRGRELSAVLEVVDGRVGVEERRLVAGGVEIWG